MKKVASLAHSSNNHINTFLKTVLAPRFAQVSYVHFQVYYTEYEVS